MNDRDRYREAAAALMPDGMTISPYANVQVCEGGAFVEAQVWVPEELLEATCGLVPLMYVGDVTLEYKKDKT